MPVAVRQAPGGQDRSVSIPKTGPESRHSAPWCKLPHTIGRKPFQHMRRVIFVFTLSLFVCGCSKQNAQPQREQLVRGLADAWEPVPRDVSLEIYEEDYGQRTILRCVLRNVSGKAIDVDHQTLPWYNADGFWVIAVAADGTVVGRTKDPPPFFGSRIGPPPGRDIIPPSASMQGTIDPSYLSVTQLPRNQDLFLLWSYHGLKTLASSDQYLLNGITLLNAKSPATTSAAIKLADVSATSVPTQQLKQDLRDAPETLLLDNAVLRLLVFPWVNRMPMAGTRDRNTDLVTPDSRPMHISFRLISEQGTRLPLSLRVQSLWIVQDSQMWNGGEIEEIVGDSNGSSREFLVHDGPHWRSMTPVDVVLALRDGKGAIGWVAARHQQIVAVE
jgi:hypothetical protein